MRSLVALVKKDLRGYFDQPTGYILIVIFVALLSYWFFRSALLTSENSLRPLFTTEFTVERPSLPWLLVLFVPAATMRLLAEEQRDGTLEILLTQPIRAWVVLIGKFVTGVLFVGIAILSTIGLPIGLATAGSLDEGAIIGQYVGSIFLAASFVSIGLFTSSLTRNQIVAFILGLTAIALLMMVGMEQVSVTLPPRLASLLRLLSPVTHFATIARGVIDLRDVLYFIALISTFLSAAFLMMRAKSLSHKSIQYRNLQLGVAGLIVLSMLVGWFGTSIAGRLDLTEEKLFTLSPGTTQILSGLDDILTVEFFKSKDPPVQASVIARDVEDFLEEFVARSGGNVKLVERFPLDDDADALKSQLAGVPPIQYSVQSEGELQVKTGFMGLAMTYVDRRQVVPVIESIDGFEYRLASLAHTMLQKEQDRKTLAFLTGYGERSLSEDMSTLASLLAQQFDVIEVASTEEGPPDLSGVDVLILAGPTERIPESVEQSLHDYLAGGGKAMVLIDPVLVDEQLVSHSNRYSFANFVERYGVFVEENLVFDVESNEILTFPTQVGSLPLRYPFWIRARTVDRKVTGQVESVLMPWASSLGISTEPVVGVDEVIPLVRSTAAAAVSHELGNAGPNSPQLDLTGREQFESDIGVAITGPAEGGGSYRMVVVGDSDWLTGQATSRSEENLALVLNLVDWLAQEEALAAIRSKVVTTRQLAFTSPTHENGVQYGNIIGVPLAFILFGLWRYARRTAMGTKVYGREK